MSGRPAVCALELVERAQGRGRDAMGWAIGHGTEDVRVRVWRAETRERRLPGERGRV